VGLRSERSGSAARFAQYVETITSSLGHADRAVPFRSYCAGLLLPGDRKSIEPIAARVDAARVQAAHQSLHHLVAKSDWSDDAVLAAVRGHVLPIIHKRGPIRALIVDDTGMPKKGRHSVGVARQYCGQLGKQDNCQVAVSLSMPACRSPIGSTCRRTGPLTETGASGPACRTMLFSRPSRKSHSARSVRPLPAGSRPKWCWPTRVTATTPTFAMVSPQPGWLTSLASNRRLVYGRPASTRYRQRHGVGVAVRPRRSAAMPITSLFRPRQWHWPFPKGRGGG
jgi:hypothetical protein